MPIRPFCLFSLGALLSITACSSTRSSEAEPSFTSSSPPPSARPIACANPRQLSPDTSDSCGSGGPHGQVERRDYDGSYSWVGAPADAREPLPLIVVLHGDEGEPTNMLRFFTPVWRRRRNFILMAPECPRGLCNKGGVNTWSAGSWDHSEPQSEWLRGAIADVANAYSVDVSRIHAIGFSGGAIFLGYQGFKRFQDIFASIQWFCGGVNETEEQVYQAPQVPACKVAGRLVVSRSGDRDYIVSAANRIEEILQHNGHHVEFLDTGCLGHCCEGTERADDLVKWALAQGPKCGAPLGEGCHFVTGTP
ncbi:MAG: hypothetical protein U0271_14040 [Polyangiaceae bacterium]